MECLPLSRVSHAYQAIGSVITRLTVTGITAKDFYPLMQHFTQLTALELSNIPGLDKDYMELLFRRLNSTLTELHLVDMVQFPLCLEELRNIRVFHIRCDKIEEDHEEFLWQNKNTLEDLDYDCKLLSDTSARPEDQCNESVEEGYMQDMEDALYEQIGTMANLKKLSIHMNQSIADLMVSGGFPLLEELSFHSNRSGLSTFFNRLDGRNLRSIVAMVEDDIGHCVSLPKNRFPLLEMEMYL